MPRNRYPWIKLWNDCLSDPKLRQLTAAERGMFYEMLLLANNSPVRGYLMVTEKVPMTAKIISKLLNLSTKESKTLTQCLPKLVSLEILKCNDNYYMFPRFEARQEVYPSDYPPNKLRINSAKTPLDQKKDQKKDQRAPLISPHKKATESFDDYTKALRDRFRNIKDFDAELEKFQLWWAEGGLKMKRPKLALLNWMTKASKTMQEAINEKTGERRGDRELGGGFAKLPTHYTDPDSLRIELKPSKLSPEDIVRLKSGEIGDDELSRKLKEAG